MRARIAESYEIINILNFIKDNAVRLPGLSSEDSIQECRATIMEHIMRHETKLAVLGNKIVGLAFLSSNGADDFYAVDTKLNNAEQDGALSALMSA